MISFFSMASSSLREYLSKHSKFKKLNCRCYFCLLPKLLRPIPSSRLSSTMSDTDQSLPPSSPQEDPLKATKEENIRAILSSSDEESVIVLEEQQPANTQEGLELSADEPSTSTGGGKRRKVCWNEKKVIVTIPSSGKMRPVTRGKAKATVKLTSAQQIKVWEAQDNTFLAVLLLMWNETILVDLIPFMSHMNTVAMKARNLSFKKKIMVWHQALQLLKRNVGETFTSLQYLAFKTHLQSMSSYTLFIDFVLPDEWIDSSINEYVDFRSSRETPSNSSASTETTSTSCTIASGQVAPAGADSSGPSDQISEPLIGVQRGGLFGATNSAPLISLVPCSICRREDTSLVTFSSVGKCFNEDSDLVLKLDIVPYRHASRTQKKDWWNVASLRTTVTFSANSELASAVKTLEEAIEHHFQTEQVGKLRKEERSLSRYNSGSNYSGGSDSFHRRH
ncbi:nonstructural protein [Bactericera trigonica densovirus]|uniref:Nonstructural protein n=1 Tax=Bactericera trigonica densovirus TaxID=3070179 RepID=A0A5C1K2L7_9VIRU|nr:nonstructural protein [Bactericera trigonica densovirus]QEM39033.1 nonstructural protein [Bactericera trigonica densovirus]